MPSLVIGLVLTAEEQEQITDFCSSLGKSVAELSKELLLSSAKTNQRVISGTTQIDMSYFQG